MCYFSNVAGLHPMPYLALYPASYQCGSCIIALLLPYGAVHGLPLLLLCLTMLEACFIIPMHSPYPMNGAIYYAALVVSRTVKGEFQNIDPVTLPF